MERAAKAALDVASDSAREGLDRFGLACVRVWLAVEDTIVLAGSANAQMNTSIDSMTTQAVREAMSGEPVLKGAFMGVPLKEDSTTIGFVECYALGAISFADAAEIERWAAGVADAIVVASAVQLKESPKRGNVLIADDDPAIRRLIEALLTRNGFTVTAVENGHLACERAQTLLPDLILLDWMMPVLDGRSATARLKNNPKTRHIPVVMLTSQARTEDKVSALEAGAQDYLTKPFDSRELVARIEQQLRWRDLLSGSPGNDAAPRPPPQPAPAAQTGDEGYAPPPPGGDYWNAAVAAQQVGKLRHALEYYVQEAENCDNAKQFPRAAIAFRSASVVAGQVQNLDLSNKLLRLAGKMYLSWAESANDAKAVQEAYVNAARCFLSAGNLKLAKKSVEIAESMHSVIGDDRPSPLR